MKKCILFAALAMMFSVSTAFAQTGGFTGPGGAVSTAAEAQKMPDDAPVTLTGKIEKNLGGDKYLFRDRSGTIVLEIGSHDWRGVTVGENDVVEVTGEVDRDLGGVTVDVDWIVKK